VWFQDFSKDGGPSEETECDRLLLDLASVLYEKLDLLRWSSTFFSLIGTPPPLPLGCEVAFPFAAYFFLSSIEESLDPTIDENADPLLPLEVTDALEDCTGGIGLLHGVRWVFSMGENALVLLLSLVLIGECRRANLSARSFSAYFFSAFSMFFSVTLRALAPLEAIFVA
jgi:hypothetical protein